jgi:hypothetical protein
MSKRYTDEELRAAYFKELQEEAENRKNYIFLSKFRPNENIFKTTKKENNKKCNCAKCKKQ